MANPRVGLFRIAAIAEACSWAGLLVGMFFKYVVVHNEIGVKIFGPIHGVIFIVYVVSVFLAAGKLRLGVLGTLVGLVAAIPPFATVLFERWALRRAAVATRTLEPVG